MIRRLVEKRRHVVVQGIHVLHQPIIRLIIHLGDMTEGVGGMWVDEWTFTFSREEMWLKRTTGYLSSIVNDGEVGLPTRLLRSEKFGMVALLSRQLLHK